MKRPRLFWVIALAITLGGCGSSNSSSTHLANGAWSAALSSSTAQSLGSFTFTMTQNGTALSGSDMNFATMDSLAPCFGMGTTMNGNMGQGMMNGGTMTMTMSWTAPNNGGTNTVAMNGDMGMGMHSGSGTFTLTGHTSGCASEDGNFTMTHQ